MSSDEVTLTCLKESIRCSQILTEVMKTVDEK